LKRVYLCLTSCGECHARVTTVASSSLVSCATQTEGLSVVGAAYEALITAFADVSLSVAQGPRSVPWDIFLIFVL